MKLRENNLHVAIRIFVSNSEEGIMEIYVEHKGGERNGRKAGRNLGGSKGVMGGGHNGKCDFRA